MAKRKLPNRSSIKAFLRTDRGTLLICMLVSLLFWLIVKLSEDFRSKTFVSLEFNIPVGFTFTEPPPDRIEVSLEGRGWDLLGSAFGKKDPIVFEVQDQSELLINTTELKDRAQVGLSKRIGALGTRPDFLRLNLEPRLQKMIPVLLQSRLDFGDQHMQAGPTLVWPDSVVIDGPLSIVGEISEWPTQWLELANVREPITLSVPLDLPENSQISLSPAEVSVTVPVEPYTEKIVFVPVTVLNATDSLRIYPGQVRVSFPVGLSRYDEVARESFSATVDLRNVNPGGEANTAPVVVTCHHPEIEEFLYSPRSVEFYLIEQD